MGSRTDATMRRTTNRGERAGRSRVETGVGAGPASMGWPSLIAVALALFLVALFVALARDVMLGRSFAVDYAARRAARAFASPALTAALGGTMVLLGPAIVVVVLLMGAWLHVRRRSRTALALLGSEAGAFILYAALKGAIHRVRPTDVAPPADVFGYLFPSGHTMGFIVTFGLLGYLVAGHRRGWIRAATVLVVAAALACVAFSLIYLDTHYATDVLGGLLVGGAWLIFSVLGLRLAEWSQGLPNSHRTYRLRQRYRNCGRASIMWRGPP